MIPHFTMRCCSARPELILRVSRNKQAPANVIINLNANRTKRSHTPLLETSKIRFYQNFNVFKGHSPTDNKVRWQICKTEPPTYIAGVFCFL